MRLRTLRHLVVLVFTLFGLALLPWTIWLSSSLSPHHVTQRWDIAWSGFDSALAISFLLTAFAAWRRSPWVGALAATTGTLLVTDAWFDVVLESHADELRNSIMLAVFVELPMAAVCFWIAYRTERFLAQVLHLTAPGKRPAEGDFIGVLEVTADGEPARESRDADATA